MLFDGQSTSTSFKKDSLLRSVTIVDFMWQVRKVPLGDKITFRDVMDSLF